MWSMGHPIGSRPRVGTSTTRYIESSSTREAPQKNFEWTLFTDGLRKGPDNTAYWGFILKKGDKEETRQQGRAPGSMQAGGVTAVIVGLLELENRKIKHAPVITDSH